MSEGRVHTSTPQICQFVSDVCQFRRYFAYLELELPQSKCINRLLSIAQLRELRFWLTFGFNWVDADLMNFDRNLKKSGRCLPKILSQALLQSASSSFDWQSAVDMFHNRFPHRCSRRRRRSNSFFSARFPFDSRVVCVTVLCVCVYSSTIDSRWACRSCRRSQNLLRILFVYFCLFADLCQFHCRRFVNCTVNWAQWTEQHHIYGSDRSREHIGK